MHASGGRAADTSQIELAHDRDQIIGLFCFIFEKM